MLGVKQIFGNGRGVEEPVEGEEVIDIGTQGGFRDPPCMKTLQEVEDRFHNDPIPDQGERDFFMGDDFPGVHGVHGRPTGEDASNGAVLQRGVNANIP